MINNKYEKQIGNKVKKKSPKPALSQSKTKRSLPDNFGSSKIFKKLSMSFYNWATKNNEKQVVCEDFNTSYEDKGCQSLTNLNNIRTQSQPAERSLEKKKKRRKYKQSKHLKQPPAEINEYYVERPKQKRKNEKKYGKSPEFSQYIHYQTPTQITQLYIRRYKNKGSKQSKSKPKSKKSSLSKQTWRKPKT